MNRKFCPHCMAPVEEGQSCRVCGLIGADYKPSPHHLPPGTVLKERYLVGGVLGEGGFGVTYVGRDLQLELMEPLFFALEEMHAGGLIHRDISPENLMLEKGSVRLLDFGCARNASEGGAVPEQRPGTLDGCVRFGGHHLFLPHRIQAAPGVGQAGGGRADPAPKAGR